MNQTTPAITLAFSPETRQRLQTNAARAGQSVEDYLADLVARDTQDVSGTSSEGEGERTPEDEELEGRPWRGVFVPARSHKPLFRVEVDVNSATLPKRATVLNMNWHRAGSGDA